MRALPSGTASRHILKVNHSFVSTDPDIKHSPIAIKLSSDGSGTTIAFIPEFTNPEVFHAPSIPPTAMRFQNYPFRATPGGQNLNVEGVDQGNNMLLYLEMTKKRDMPEHSLTTTEPWVVPGPDNRLVDGCVALSRKIFLEEWFIPKLIALNWHTDLTASVAEYEAGVFKDTWNYDWTQSRQDIDYNFKYQGIVDNEAVYTFEHASEEKNPKDSNNRTLTKGTSFISLVHVNPTQISQSECEKHRFDPSGTSRWSLHDQSFWFHQGRGRNKDSGLLSLVGDEFYRSVVLQTNLPSKVTGEIRPGMRHSSSRPSQMVVDLKS